MARATLALALSAALLLPAIAHAEPVTLIEEFNGPAIDHCVFGVQQADARYLAFGAETLGVRARTFLSNSADGDFDDASRQTPEGSCARRPAAEAARPIAAAEEKADAVDIGRLGPSFVVPPAELDNVAALTPGGLANCPEKIEGTNPETGREGTISQKNELRLAPEYVHDVAEGHWYSLDFRALGAVPTCGTMRFVVAQWKFTYDDDRPDPDVNANARSPVFALRFDNGVLHATVQSGRCTCLVASAVGDPDFRVPPLEEAPTLSLLSAKSRAPEPVTFTPRCLSSMPGEEGRICEPAAGFTAEYLRPRGSERAEPLLPDPREDWVDIDVYVEATPAPDGWPDGGRIELYANGEPIVRLTNGLGYGDARPTTMKFKFGHYRDKILARTRLDYDRLCIAGGPALCGPSRTFDQRLEPQ